MNSYFIKKLTTKNGSVCSKRYQKYLEVFRLNRSKTEAGATFLLSALLKLSTSLCTSFNFFM